MPAVVLIGFAAVVLWSLVSHRFERWGVAGPAGLLVLGAIAVIWDVEAFATAIDAPPTEKIVEVILAVLLFVDAIEVKGGLFGNEGRVTLRLVLIALPMSLVLGAAASWLLVPETAPFLMIVIACVILPTDFAPAAEILRVRYIPDRVRQILNVESGYNDGIVSPLFAMMLPLATIWAEIVSNAGKDLSDAEIDKRSDQVGEAIIGAVPATLVAILLGVVLGFVCGTLVRLCRRHDLVSDAGVRGVMLLIPLIAYGIATLPALGANGFVAAFVAGIAYRMARTRGEEERAVAHDELVLVEETGTLAANFVWFILGGAALLAFSAGVGWDVVLLALLALTVLRIVPVYLSLMGSSVAPRERLLIGALGPRGTASIVFGLLAYNALPDEQGELVLVVMVVTVVGSIVLHGLAAPLLLRRMSPAGRANLR
ncbi:cation:proton antiporter [Microbacterium sp. LWH12-1.2]|uniref:cation:proton antiporter domain-containing protein n=1 Tax=Microbacterium sp. LWH12-1.2 TaxID=3135259 RepID=UPI003436A8EE